MLVRAKGKIINNALQFDFPALFFEKKSFVCLQNLIIKFRLTQNSVTGNISTSLIDRSPINPEQILADFQSNIASKNFYYQPTHLQYYKIQQMDLTSSEFNLKFRENIKFKEIDEIEILLHITDARIQQRSEQSIF